MLVSLDCRCLPKHITVFLLSAEIHVTMYAYVDAFLLPIRGVHIHYIYTRTYVHTYMHTYIHTDMHTCLLTCIHTDLRTYTSNHKHIHCSHNHACIHYIPSICI